MTDLLRRSDALADGMTDGELARLVRRRELTRLQRGTYLRDAALLAGEARHVAVVRATVAGLRVPGVVSHVSAAVLHGLPLWNVPLGRVHVTRRPPAHGSGSRRVHLHVARLPDDEVTVVDGVALTDLARTSVDVARTLPFEQAVIVVDAALATRKVTRDELIACLDRLGPVPGARRATRVVAFADGRSESPGESRSRVLMHRLRLPAPDLQLRVHRPDGREVARCDFGWPEQQTVAEFDGRIKYGRLLRPGQDPGDAVFEEKLREDEIRDGGWKVARWIWRELDSPQVIGDRLRRAFARR
ncbi:type IV toxin-antitoxin system AbiEi family antitoxin domain-containing protein [Geodermatophilus sp. URMC 64]